MARAFLSYGREDLTTAKRLYKDLRLAGVDVWFDAEELLPGQSWRPAISDAIRCSDFVVVLLSRSAVGRRGFVHSEIREALKIRAELPGDRPFLIPLRVDDCEVPYPDLRDIQWENLYEDWERAVEKVLRVLRPARAARNAFRATYLIAVRIGTDLEAALAAARAIPHIVTADLVMGPDDIAVDFVGPPSALEATRERLIHETNAARIRPVLRGS